MNRLYEKSKWEIVAMVTVFVFLVFIVIVLTFGFSEAQDVSGLGKSEFVDITLSESSTDSVKMRGLTAQVGDSSLAKFKPTMNISAWDGECYLKIDLRGDTNNTISSLETGLTNDAGKISGDIGSNKSFSIYKRKDRNLEWEIILKSKPDTNIFSFDIETQGLNFYYQDTLTDYEIDTLGIERPDSVIGSYAVYHSTRKNDLIKSDGTRENYGTGKAFHVYRPKAWDSGGDTVWCILDINTKSGELTITAPQDFLDSATYPVTIDPTFGYSPMGGSNGTGISSEAKGNSDVTYQYTASTGDNVDTLRAWSKSYSGAYTLGVAVYTIDGNNRPDTRTGAVGTLSGSGSATVTLAQPVDIALSNGVTYTLAVGEGVNGARYFYDAGDATDESRQNVNNTLNATWTHAANATGRISIYAIYSESGGEATKYYRRRILQNGR